MAGLGYGGEHQGGEVSGLAAVKKAMSAGVYSVRKKLNEDEALSFVRKKIETDNVLKLREQGVRGAGDSDKGVSIGSARLTWSDYLDNYNFYVEQIGSYLTQEGVGVYRTGEEGLAVEIPRREITCTLASYFVGFDCLEEAMDDPLVTDVYCVSWNKIFVERNGVNEPYHKIFRNESAYHNFIDRILRIAGKTVDVGENKEANFAIYGIRGQVWHEVVATKGFSLTLRKHDERPIRLERILKQNVMTQEIADMLGVFIAGETNMIVAGITGSGKTTTLRALLNEYVPPLRKRVIVIEDTQELSLENDHTVNLVTFKTDNERTSVDLRKLIISALRMKPKYIIVGEVRGQEAEAMVEGMETGHSTLTTMHGGNVWNIINRLVNKYLMQMTSLTKDVVERIIGTSLNFVIIQDDVPGVGRRITSVNEISFDFSKDQITVSVICEYDFKKACWVWKNCISDESINTMTRRGVSEESILKLNSYISDMRGKESGGAAGA